MLRPSLLDGVDAFLRLENAWNDLARSVTTCHFTQTFEWAKLGWEARDASAGDRLICATVWSGERLVAVWPFQRNRLGFATRLEPLGCGMHEEYGDPLIASGINAASICKELMLLLRPMADVIEVPFVRHDSPIRKELINAGAFHIPDPLDAYALERRGSQSFDSLLQTYSANFRANLKQKRKRLQKLGTLRFELPEDYDSCKETIDWVVGEKRRWLQRLDKQCSWLGKDEVVRFFRAASTRRSEFGRVGLFRLTLDGKPVAAFLATIDRARVEMLTTSFEPEYGRFSPGMLIIEDVARWCFERGLDFDMRILHMDYKERWANAATSRIKYRVPMTWKGAGALLPDYLRFSLRHMLHVATNAEQRAALRRMLKWRPAPKGRNPSSGGQIGLRPIQEE
ncbi:GNAT family N-acetyltransferase [Aliirhizobium smilacinae]|uniref:GNAT family N-acetyltransferase n=1 Tax=Aliirhizobium smilacinae TaxID=1395944 RepID=A0A5C4XNE8_9HYPH|nr:GNAT family N-acetyltransferase [Rhizobium smilacinae]TNM64858.1 GNAT family N-acetyltransferase [Rhizobium smilacinae]